MIGQAQDGGIVFINKENKEVPSWKRLLLENISCVILYGMHTWLQ